MDWIPGIFRRRKLYDDLSEEMSLHIEEHAEQLMRDGASRQEAERQARISFGNRTVVEECSREVWQWPTLESIFGDVRFALRQLRRSPGFTVAAVLTLALAIGANAVVFSILNAFLLRPLNVSRPESLYQLQHGNEASAYRSYPDYLDLRDRNRSFDSLIAYTIDEVGLAAGSDPTEVWVEEASGNYFDALGLQPYLGHFFHAPDEHGANSAPYVVLSLLRALSAWRPFPAWPIQLSVNPDPNVYLVAVLLAIASGLLFGAVPVRQVLETNPYGIVKAGSTGRVGRWISVREVLLVAQIAICALLVTSSLVSVRGLIYSLHAKFGFDTGNTMLAEADLSMARYRGDRVPPMQKRMIEAMEVIPGVEAVALADNVPFSMGISSVTVFADNTTDLRQANAAASPYIFHISPGYFRAAGTALLLGRDFSWRDDKTSPPVAVVNGEFARMLFGSVNGALGRWYKMRDGRRIQVVGICEDGKYENLTEERQPAVFIPILQEPAITTTLVVRARPLLGNNAGSNASSSAESLATPIRDALRQLDPGMPVIVQTRTAPMAATLFGPRMATVALGVLGAMGVMISITGIFGMAAYSVSKRLKELGIRLALGVQRRQVLQAALGRAVRLLMIGSSAGLALGLLATRILAFIVYKATPHDPLVLSGVVLAMALLGLVATWIPAQRALSADPLVLLREE